MGVEALLSGFQVVYFEQLPKDFFFGKRKDRKYILHINELKDILDHLIKDYAIVSNNGNIVSNYITRYLDSDDLKHYYDHLHGRLNRLKYRIRTYEDGQSYFEIKGKRNTGYTMKSRVEVGNDKNDGGDQYLIDEVTQKGLDHHYGSSAEDQKLLTEWNRLKDKGYKDQMQIQYDRITLFSNDFREKITIDLHLNFEKDDASWSSDNLVIMESKMTQNHISVFRELMRALHIGETSFSKYCFGIATLVPSIKRNNFKQLLRITEKIISKYEISSSDL